MRFKTIFRWAACLGLAVLISVFQGCGKNVNPATPASSSGGSTPSYSFVNFFGNGVMSQPVGLAVSGDIAWVANTGGGTALEAWGLLGVLKKTITVYSSFTVTSPRQVGVGADGSVYMVDSGNYQVAEFTPTGTWVNTFGKAELGTDVPEGVAVNGNYAYVSDLTGVRLLRYTIAGSGPSKTFTASATFGNSGPGALSGPYQLALDGAGNVYAADVQASKVFIYNANGVFQSAITLSTSTFNGASGIALDSSGNIYLDGGALSDVEMFSPSGSLLAHIGTATGIAADGMGFDSAGDLYVTDQGGYQVAVFQKN